MNQLMSDEAVYRTAPATLGLLTSVKTQAEDHIHFRSGLPRVFQSRETFVITLRHGESNRFDKSLSLQEEI